MNLLAILGGQGPADTMVYMVAGYTVFFTIMAAYLLSLVIRTRNLKQDFELLQDLEKDSAD
jgi:hypothetical protein